MDYHHASANSIKTIITTINFYFQRRSLRSPRKMDRLRRSFRDSFRRRKDRVPESSKPHQWQADESAVRAGTCTFAVKYLGCVEVFDSRGMQVCEEALKVLRVSYKSRFQYKCTLANDVTFRNLIYNFLKPTAL